MMVTKPVIKRILVPLAAQHTPARLLENAADIAFRLQSELCGLFIEDSDLLNFAQLPIGREFSFSTGRIQHSNIDTMERSLRHSASRSQQEIRRLATSYKIQSQFVTRRGHTQQTMLLEVQPDDLLILSGQGQQATGQLLKQAHEFLQSGHHYLAWLPPNALATEDITVLQNNSPAAAHSIEIARLLAKDHGHSISTYTYTDIDSLRNELLSNQQHFWVLPYQQEWVLSDLEKLLPKAKCPILIVNI